MDGLLFVFLLGLALAIFVVIKGFIIVRQAEVVLIERLGRYHRMLNSGPNILIPFFDSPREVIWREQIPDPTHPGRQIGVPLRRTRVDLRETVMDFARQNVITKDNVTVEINALLYFQVTAPLKAVYEIQNLPNAIEKLTQTTLRNVVGELELDQTLTSRDTINQKLRGILDDATDKWGVKVNRVELQDINPPQQIRDDMEKQMRAERERRAQVLAAEGEKRAAILSAEGHRESQIATAQGDKTAAVLRAEGLASAKLLVAKADADSIDTVFQAVKSPEASVQYLVAMKYIEALESIAQSPQKTVFMPYEASGVLGSLGTIKDMWKRTD
jgi:regulator of protease activity HflC (stomatin/prohibitin superfamily)